MRKETTIFIIKSKRFFTNMRILIGVYLKKHTKLDGLGTVTKDTMIKIHLLILFKIHVYCFIGMRVHGTGKSG